MSFLEDNPPPKLRTNKKPAYKSGFFISFHHTEGDWSLVACRSTHKLADIGRMGEVRQAEFFHLIPIYNLEIGL